MTLIGESMVESLMVEGKLLQLPPSRYRSMRLTIPNKLPHPQNLVETTLRVGSRTEVLIPAVPC